MQKDLNTIWTRAENRPNRKPKNCFTSPLECKHHLDTADAKRPKHHLDTRRKRPKPQTKKLFHVTFGIQSKTATEHKLWSHREHAQPMQTQSGHCRCKKTQRPSGHAPKTAQTLNQKTVSRHLWNPHKTSFGATEHMPSLCKHHLDTADAKRPKHHLDTTEHMPSLCKHHVDTADAKRPKHRAQTPKTSKLLGALPLCEGVGGYNAGLDDRIWLYHISPAWLEPPTKRGEWFPLFSVTFSACGFLRGWWNTMRGQCLACFFFFFGGGGSHWE